MTLDQLRYFHEAARLQHVGRAARAVRVSPSAISTAIAALESELRCRLFVRTGRSIVLTDSGRVLLREAEKIQLHIARLPETLQGAAASLRGRFRFGASHFLCARHLVPAWNRLQQSHPELLGELCAMPTATVLTEVVAGTLDLGLCFSPFAHPELESEALFEGKLVLVTRRAHPLTRLDARGVLKKLSEYPAVFHKARPGVEACETHPVFENFGITPRVCNWFDSDDCAIRLLADSDAWALLPEVVATEQKTKVQCLRLLKGWDAAYRVSSIVRKDRKSNAVLGALRDQLKRRFD